MACGNFIRKSHNKLNSTWKIINTETGRIPKHNNFQDLIKKFTNLNAAEQINDYFISIGNKSIKIDKGKHGNSSATEFLSYMQQASLKNYPEIYNAPSTPKEIEKNN
jgi:hypothetical protein